MLPLAGEKNSQEGELPGLCNVITVEINEIPSGRGVGFAPVGVFVSGRVIAPKEILGMHVYCSFQNENTRPHFVPRRRLGDIEYKSDKYTGGYCLVSSTFHSESEIYQIAEAIEFAKERGEFSKVEITIVPLEVPSESFEISKIVLATFKELGN